MSQPLFIYSALLHAVITYIVAVACFGGLTARGLTHHEERALIQLLVVLVVLLILGGFLYGNAPS